MPPRKGLSFEEKRTRLLALLHETAEFYTLKELEKLGHKRKGITSQSVKEVLQSLVDDNMVTSDKCGNQTVYWSLPSTATQTRRLKLETYRTSLSTKQREARTLKSSISKLTEGRESSAERDSALAKLRDLQAKSKELDTAIARFATLNPAAIKKLREDTVQLKSGANRWTDNIFAIQSWAVNKHNLDKSQFNKQFEISDELDYLE